MKLLQVKDFGTVKESKMLNKDQLKQILEWVGRIVIAIITFLLYNVQSTLTAMNNNLTEMKIMVATYGKEVESLKAEFYDYRTQTNTRLNAQDESIKVFYRDYDIKKK